MKPSISSFLRSSGLIEFFAWALVIFGLVLSMLLGAMVISSPYAIYGHMMFTVAVAMLPGTLMSIAGFILLAFLTRARI